MRQIRTAPPKDEREYPLVITAEEKDKILTALLKKANGTEKAALKYEDIPELKINKAQYKTVIDGFKTDGLIKEKGYSEIYEFTDKIHTIKEKGGFERQIELFHNQVEQLHKSLNEEEKSKLLKFLEKTNTGLETANNLESFIKIIRNVLLLFS